MLSFVTLYFCRFLLIGSSASERQRLSRMSACSIRHSPSRTSIAVYITRFSRRRRSVVTRRPMSASTRHTLCPSRAMDIPRFADVVVFPTPPFPDVITITRVSASSSASPRASSSSADAPAASVDRARDICDRARDARRAPRGRRRANGEARRARRRRDSSESSSPRARAAPRTTGRTPPRRRAAKDIARSSRLETNAARGSAIDRRIEGDETARTVQRRDAGRRERAACARVGETDGATGSRARCASHPRSIAPLTPRA